MTLFQDPDLGNESSPEPGTQEILRKPRAVHGDKLRELLKNDKLPNEDRPRVKNALERYAAWRAAVGAILTDDRDERLRQLVDLLNGYMLYIDLELIFDSPADFLHRQKGQLKITSSIIEEFLPDLVTPEFFPSLRGLKYGVGPYKAFAAASFEGTFLPPVPGAGLTIRTKDHDFTIGRDAWLAASYSEEFPPPETTTKRIYLAFFAAECKTNLDKTMFQEAAATAHDLRVAIPGSRYFLICEWLDMTPISTAGTDIREVLILRGKRVASNVRSGYATREGRSQSRGEYEKRILASPVRLQVVQRLMTHIEAVVEAEDILEDEAVERGYF
jgi:hypothetical protein